MTMSFYDDTQHEIEKLKKELLKLIKKQETIEIEKETELYSNFITDVGKLSGKIEGLEMSIRIYNKYHK